MGIRKLTETVDFLKSKIKEKPRIGIILGSGLGHFVSEMKVEVAFPFADVPNFIPPTVEGHSGNLIFGSIDGVELVVMQGRVHFYEGHTMETVVFPTRVMALLGIEILIVTNSAGGYGESLRTGPHLSSLRRELLTQTLAFAGK